MNVERIMLEITRNCDLVCEHCCRGDKQVVNMSIDTIDNIFSGVSYVKELFLTGGEPLIAIIQLEYLAKLIEEGKFKIAVFSFITNATVLSSRTLTALKTIQKHAVLDIRLSSDIFHIMELERLGLLKKRSENIKVLKELFGLKLHTSTDSHDSKYKNRGLLAAGRAKDITKERLAEINAMLPFDYIISKYFGRSSTSVVRGNGVIGSVYIDVNGFIIDSEYPEFEVEDEAEKRYATNVNEMSFREAVLTYNKVYEEILAEKLLCRK